MNYDLKCNYIVCFIIVQWFNLIIVLAEYLQFLNIVPVL